jgi:hypothetical protein
MAVQIGAVLGRTGAEPLAKVGTARAVGLPAPADVWRVQ